MRKRIISNGQLQKTQRTLFFFEFLARVSYRQRLLGRHSQRIFALRENTSDPINLKIIYPLVRNGEELLLLLTHHLIFAYLMMLSQSAKKQSYDAVVASESDLLDALEARVGLINQNVTIEICLSLFRFLTFPFLFLRPKS